MGSDRLGLWAWDMLRAEDASEGLQGSPEVHLWPSVLGIQLRIGDSFCPLHVDSSAMVDAHAILDGRADNISHPAKGCTTVSQWCQQR